MSCVNGCPAAMSSPCRLSNALAIGLALVALPVRSGEVLWVDWISGSESVSGFTAVGTINTVNGVVTVTYLNPRGVSFLQDGVTERTTNYFSYEGSSPYQSAGLDGVDNDPPAAEMVAQIYSDTQVLTFSEPIEDLYFAFVSLNGNTYSFDHDFSILSNAGSNFDGQGTDGAGHWGQGPVERVEDSGGLFSLRAVQGEPHGTILFKGRLDQLVWSISRDENWHGFTVGIRGAPKPISEGTLPKPERWWRHHG